MPARKGRHGLTAAADGARAAVQIAGLQEAAARAGRLHAWLDAARPHGPLPPAPAAKPLPARPKRGLWPFGRKLDAEAERQAEILAELEAAIEGRPFAVARARDRAPPAELLPLSDRKRAAG